MLSDDVADQLNDDLEEEGLPDQLPYSKEVEAEKEMQNSAEENGTAEEEMRTQLRNMVLMIMDGC
jgi:hypothetical protein